MLGLVQYSDSEDEREEPQPAGNRQQQGRAAAPAAAPHQQQAAAPPAPASGLPSAADLLGGGAPQVRLPPPDFGQGRAAVGARQQMGPAAAAAGAKRGHPDTRGPLPNPMALDAKVPRSGGAQNVGGAKPSTAAGGLLLPPQLRGRANVATEDLSTMFTKQAVQRAQQRRSSGGSSGGGGGGGS